ncbi:MAG TPA: hypothetical protein VK589_19990 [Chryseolinea sp.]|nr:hypothetical protein [Chryseolinea sp.]
MTKLLLSLSLVASYIESCGQSAASFDFSNYSYIVPDKWRSQKEQDYIMLAQSLTTEPSCIILIFPPQPSTGNLEQDAQNVIQQMYPGWQFRSVGAKQYDLTKGFTTQGLEYCMLEAGMSKLAADGSRYDGFEDGGALVIKTGNQIVIIASRHTTMLAHTDCVNKYETWRRFFISFTVKNAIIPKRVDDPPKRIIGVWTLSGYGPASGEYIFAANGNYQLTGGLGTSSTTRDQNYEYLHIKTYAFQGDGGYSMTGSQLSLKKRNDKNPEQAQFRFEQVNHGGTGWKDRLCLLKTDPTLRTKYEVCYERK